MDLPLIRQSLQIAGHAIHFFAPQPAIVKARFAKGELTDPYWSRVWPAARVLTDFLLTHPEFIKRKRVLELGAGLGLPSMAIASLAQSVTCTDIVPEAVACMEASIHLNGFSSISAAVVDWCTLKDLPHIDVVLLSDVNYESKSFASLYKTLTQLLANGKTIILATPERLMAKDFIDQLLPAMQRQQSYQTEQDGIPVWVTVLVLQNQE